MNKNNNNNNDSKKTKKLIEETNDYIKEDFVSMFLESLYPGFSDYIKATKDSGHITIASPILVGTENLIEETKQLIKESCEDFDQKTDTCTDEPQELYIDVAALPNYLGDTMQERLDKFLKLESAGIKLKGLPEDRKESKLLSWIGKGVGLITEEIEAAVSNLDNLYYNLNTIKEEIIEEEDRLGRLKTLLELIEK